MLSPLLLRIGAALVMVSLIFGAGWYVRALKADSDLALIERAATAGANKAGEKVIGAIGKLRPKYLTITNEVTRAASQDPRYSDPACYHSDAVWMQLSAAYEALGGPPLDRAGLSPSTPASGPQPGADNARAH